MALNRLWIQILAIARDLQKVEERLPHKKDERTTVSQLSAAEVRQRIYEIRSLLYKLNTRIKEEGITYER